MFNAPEDLICSHRSEALGAFSLRTLPAYAIFLRCFLGVDVTIKNQLSPTLTASEKFHVANVDFLIYFNINTCTTTHSTQCIGKLSTYIRFWDLFHGELITRVQGFARFSVLQ